MRHRPSLEQRLGNAVTRSSSFNPAKAQAPPSQNRQCIGGRTGTRDDIGLQIAAGKRVFQ